MAKLRYVLFVDFEAASYPDAMEKQQHLKTVTDILGKDVPFTKDDLQRFKEAFEAIQPTISDVQWTVKERRGKPGTPENARVRGEERRVQPPA